MDLDFIEHKLLDNFPTKTHVTYGKNTHALPYSYSPVQLGIHLKRFHIDPSKRSMIESVRSKPKKKKYENTVNKKNLEL